MALLKSTDVRGVFPPLVTPMTATEEINLGPFRDQICELLAVPVTGLVIGGSTGEGYALTPSELGELTSSAVSVVNSAVPVVTGIITTTTRNAVERAEIARDAGAVGLMVAPPIYQQPSVENLLEYYGTIHEKSGLPIIIYNVLRGFPVPPATIRQLLSLSGVIGTKESSGSDIVWLAELLATVGPDVSVTWARDHVLFPGLALGAAGTISGAAALFPRECVAMFDSIQKNDYERGHRIHEALGPIMREVMVGKNWPGLLKATCGLLGKDYGPARSPFGAPPAEQLERLTEALRATRHALSGLGLDPADQADG